MLGLPISTTTVTFCQEFLVAKVAKAVALLELVYYVEDWPSESLMSALAGA